MVLLLYYFVVVVVWWLVVGREYKERCVDAVDAQMICFIGGVLVVCWWCVGRWRCVLMYFRNEARRTCR